jgi:hypothetical protein
MHYFKKRSYFETASINVNSTIILTINNIESSYLSSTGGKSFFNFGAVVR